MLVAYLPHCSMFAELVLLTPTTHSSTHSCEPSSSHIAVTCVVVCLDLALTFGSSSSLALDRQWTFSKSASLTFELLRVLLATVDQTQMDMVWFNALLLYHRILSVVQSARIEHSSLKHCVQGRPLNARRCLCCGPPSWHADLRMPYERQAVRWVPCTVWH